MDPYLGDAESVRVFRASYERGQGISIYVSGNAERNGVPLTRFLTLTWSGGMGWSAVREAHWALGSAHEFLAEPGEVRQGRWRNTDEFFTALQPWLDTEYGTVLGAALATPVLRAMVEHVVVYAASGGRDGLVAIPVPTYGMFETAS